MDKTGKSSKTAAAKDRTAVIYSADLSCVFKSLNGAIKAAEEGSTILIAPGIYNESFTIDKNITLRGSAEPDAHKMKDAAVFCVPSGEQIIIHNCASISNIVCTPDESLVLSYGDMTCAEYEERHAALNDDEVLSEHDEDEVTYSRDPDSMDFKTFVTVRGNTSLSSVYIINSPGNGMLVNADDGDDVKLKDVHVLKSMFNNFHVRGSGSVSFVSCTAKGSVHGRGFDAGGSVTISVDSCTSSGNRRHGFGVTDSASVTMKKSLLSGNMQTGLGLWKNATAEVTRSRICDNGIEGLYAASDSAGTFENCRIENNKRNGANLQERTNIIMNGCDITGNANSGLLAYGTSQLTVTDCRINGNKRGVETHVSSSCHIQSCTADKNTVNGFFCADQSSGEITDCKINNNGTGTYNLYGILLSDCAAQKFSGCTLDENGIEACGYTEATLEKCTVCYSDFVLYVHDHAALNVRECNFHRTEDMAGMIRIYEKAKPVFTGCGKDGYPEEIFIERSAGGIYTDCVFSFAEFESEIDSSDDTEDDVALGKAEFINCTIKHRKGGC